MKKRIILVLIFLFSFFNISVFAYDLNKDSKIYVSGQSIGIKMNSGVEVVGTYGIKTSEGISKPWDDAKILIGDKIVKMNGKDIVTKEDLLDVLSKSNGKTINIVVLRNNKEHNLVITPTKSNNSYSLGLYIKDSIVGVGTLTYYIKEANIFGSLGHQMSNNTFSSGEIYEATVDDIIKPSNNKAGEKRATIIGEYIGTVEENTITGVHGYGNDMNTSNMKYIPFKVRDEIDLGLAEIWTCIDGKKIEKYEIEIIKLEKQDKKDVKGITFKVIDEDLIKQAGGIVQGMSGSPIIQDGCLIGAVTHVSVKNSKLAYGIYIEWMFEDMNINIVEE